MGNDDRQPRAQADAVLADLRHPLLFVDDDGKVVYANPAAAQHAGVRPEVMPGRPLASFIAVEHRHRVVGALERARSGHAARTVECNLGSAPSADWLELDVSPRSGGGFLVVGRDVSERRAVRAQVAEQHADLQETLASLLDSIPVGILIADKEGQPRLVNRAARDLLGLHALRRISTWRAQSFLERADGTPLRGEDLPVSLTLADGRARRDIEIHVIAPGGDRVPVLLNTEAVHDASGRVVEVCCTFTNISDRQHIERQLRHAQKMEAVGTLAGGIAHDFNNILCAIMGYSELALRHVNGQRRLRHLLDEIKRAGARAAGLTRQLLSFSRDESLAPQAIDLNSAVTDMGPMLRRLIGETVELRSELAEEMPAIHADPGQFEQVLLNLAINASDAMPRGGVLEVRTDVVETQEGHTLCESTLPPARYAVLSVTDNGSGMSESTLMHIFEPFFTTKPRGKGTGLGLSTVYGIVKQSGGHMDVRSAPDLGTTFQVYWPRTDFAPKAATPKRTRVTTDGGGETVLLVEDEDMVRRLIREILEASGYRVFEASNGREALEFSRSLDEAIDLLVTDVVMPKLNGRELAGRLQTERPGMRILFVSGYTDEALEHYGIMNGERSFLPKPFDPATLTQRVREMLDHVSDVR